jgi:hypothetical protein
VETVDRHLTRKRAKKIWPQAGAPELCWLQQVFSLRLPSWTVSWCIKPLNYSYYIITFIKIRLYIIINNNNNIYMFVYKWK